MKYLLFFPLLLWATINQPLRIEWQTGYRNDRIHWHLQDPGSPGALTYSEILRDVQFWDNALTFRVVHRDLTFFIKGSYGTFGRGDLLQKDVSIDPSTRFPFTTSGWSADATGFFGYSANLTAGRTYKVIITLLIGYSGYFMHLKRKGSSEFTSLPAAFKNTFRGVYFGPSFYVEPGNGLVLIAGYGYNLLHNDFHTQMQTTTPTLSFRQKVHSTSGGNPGHTGWVQLDWMLGALWRVGFDADILYFPSRVVDATIEQTGRGDSSEKLKLRWTKVAGHFHISRQF